MKDINFDELEVGYDVPAVPGMDAADIQTPALVLDLEISVSAYVTMLHRCFEVLS